MSDRFNGKKIVVLKESSFVQCFTSPPSAQIVEDIQTRPSAGCVRGQSFSLLLSLMLHSNSRTLHWLLLTICWFIWQRKYTSDLQGQDCFSNPRDWSSNMYTVLKTYSTRLYDTAPNISNADSAWK